MSATTHKHIDKVYHLLGGAAIAFVTALATYPLLGLAVANCVGWLKEEYDAHHTDKHTPDPWDAVATLLGGALGAGAAKLLHLHF